MILIGDPLGLDAAAPPADGVVAPVVVDTVAEPLA
jgi:hypothetical protein